MRERSDKRGRIDSPNRFMIDKVLQAKIDELKPQDVYITSRIRGLCRDAFEIALPNIASIAKGETDSSPFAQIRAMQLLGHFGLGKNPEVLLEGKEWLTLVCHKTATHFNDEQKFLAWGADLISTLEFRQ